MVFGIAWWVLMVTPKLLYRRLDALFGSLDPRDSERAILTSFLDQFFTGLREDLRLTACYYFVEQRDGFELVRAVGNSERPVAEAVSASAPFLPLVFKHRVYIFPDPAAAESPVRSLGTAPLSMAAITIGRRPSRNVLLFALGDGWALEEVDFALNTVRAALGSRLVDARARGTFREAAEIQQSLLIEEPPDFPGYEIACRSLAAEEVGGDFYDFQVFDSDLLGLSIGDASGHGLPAALLVRDVVTGLRMGVERELKVAHVFEKLNRVIHRSNLSSRFVSVFYGELESDGNLIYVNAGHQPPILFFAEGGPHGDCLELTTGGTVIGPMPESRFRRGIARVRKGEVLVGVTDGLLERRDAQGREFGLERLKDVVRRNRRASSDTILSAIFDASTAFGDTRPFEDDATAIVVRRLAS
jgi:sigma-B regulation protein RsbU (phosphoserine phosphatase)